MKIKVNEEEVSAVIRSNDPRLKGKSIYVDTNIIIRSGDVFVTESPGFYYLNDGVGKIDESYFIPTKKKKLIQSDKGIQVEFKVRGWGEMFPAEIVVK